MHRVWSASLAGLLTALPFAAAAGGPAFQIRDARPDVSARTLDAVNRGEIDPATDRVWVYFRDKGIFDTETLESRLHEHASTLDPHAASRRAKVFADEPADYHDLAVSASYVDALESAGATVVRRSRWLNAVSVNAAPGVLRQVASMPFVHKVVPVRGFRRSTVRPSETAPETWQRRSGTDPFDYGPSRGQLDEINVINAHIDGLSGEGVRIAMFDTGFVHDYETFLPVNNDGRLLAQWDFINDDPETMNEPGDDPDQDSHGTATWSVVGGLREGELVGVAFGASFLLAKTEDITSETPVEEDNWVAAAEWADTNGADVISSSLTYTDWYTYEDMDGNTAPITIAADIAVGRGIVVCSSAGNAGSSEWFYIGAPADGDSVMAVGAVDEFNALASFSSHGPTADGRIKPEVVARGLNTYCAYPDLGYAYLSGTSLSCPLVAGAVALILEAQPSWSPMNVRAALLGTADNAATPDNDRGWGRIDVIAAMQSVVSTPASSPAPTTPQLAAFPNPADTNVRIRVGVPVGIANPRAIQIFDVQGRIVRAMSLAPEESDIVWDRRSDTGAPVAPGVYLARLRAGDWTATAKIVVR